MKRWITLVGLATTIVGAVSIGALRSRPQPVPVVDRPFRLVSESIYTEEIRCLLLCGWSAAPVQGTYSGPGNLIRYSGDGKWVAMTVDDCSEGPQRIVGKLLDSQHCYTHNIEVLGLPGRERRSVLTVYDKEPGSGSAHRYRWSEDSKALLVFGEAGLRDHPERSVDLCFVYDVAADELTRMAQCPINRDAPMKDMNACVKSKQCA